MDAEKSQKVLEKVKATLKEANLTPDEMNFVLCQLSKIVLEEKKLALKAFSIEHRRNLIVKIRNRFDKYRIGFSNECNMLVQYQPFTARKQDQDRVYMYFNKELHKGYSCKNTDGTCNSDTVIDGHTSIDQLSAMFRKIEFDHMYDQGNIKKSFKWAINEVLDDHVDDCPCGAGDYIVDGAAFYGFEYNHNEPDPGDIVIVDYNDVTAAVSRKLKLKFLRYHLHMDKLVEDLYENLKPLCIECHGARGEVFWEKSRYVNQ